jgi:hypothetical protein
MQSLQVVHPSDDASKFLFGTDTVGHMLMANCSAPMCPESVSDYFKDSDPNSRYPQSAYQAALDTYCSIAYCMFWPKPYVTHCTDFLFFKRVTFTLFAFRYLVTHGTHFPLQDTVLTLSPPVSRRKSTQVSCLTPLAKSTPVPWDGLQLRTFPCSTQPHTATSDAGDCTQVMCKTSPLSFQHKHELLSIRKLSF